MSEISGFHKGQVGALIRLDTEDDATLLAAATLKQIHMACPDGTTKALTATLSGTKLTFTTTVTTDLPYAGNYFVQVYMEGPGWKLHGARATMYVADTVRPIA